MILLSLEKIPSTSPRLYKDSRKSKIIMNIQANNQHAKFETTPLTQTDGQCNIWLASELTQYSVMLISDLYDFMTLFYIQKAHCYTHCPWISDFSTGTSLQLSSSKGLLNSRMRMRKYQIYTTSLLQHGSCNS